ncbi:hypothetical protein [Nonomuraea pusilla]|uniref:Uncharacterized protein n=1 Tax=Nonomuraea pusilla TaxID=46177 RepID=A0A1H7LSK2_9ACTN|nr:hypothetical protein [Nonomuraea pusilla]SEL01347.1 hypothetical protein SAMN05660976_01647 [Nonomuraea pusilla]
MSASRHGREPGTLPRPLAALGALALVCATGLAMRVLPAGTTPEPVPAAGPGPGAGAAERAVEQVAAGNRPSAFLGFADTAVGQGFDLPAEVRWYAFGHLVAGGDGCVARWAGPRPANLAGALARLRARGGDAGPVFGGPGGRELASACTRPGALAAAYRSAVRAYGASYVGFDVRDASDPGAVARRARALAALQREGPLGVTFSLRLSTSAPGTGATDAGGPGTGATDAGGPGAGGPGGGRAGTGGPVRAGLAAADLAMLRLTRREGAEVATVDLLAELEPRSAPPGRLRRLAEAVRAAAGRLDRQGDAGPDENDGARGESWPGVALTVVLRDGGDLNEAEARKLAAYAVRHGLAWLSVRGAAPAPGVVRALARR